MSSASSLAAMFGFVIDTRLMARFCENQFFHNSISFYNKQGTELCLEKKQRKEKTVFSFSARVVAVATFDGCVCQARRPFSLMMAMPAHVWVYICVCV